MKSQITITFEHEDVRTRYILQEQIGIVAGRALSQPYEIQTETFKEKMPMTVRFLSNGEPVTTDELEDFFEPGATVEIVESGDKYRSWDIIKMLEVR